MERSENDNWVAVVVDAVRPRVLAQAKMCHRLGLAAVPPEDVVERITVGVLARLRAPKGAETGRGGSADGAGT